MKSIPKTRDGNILLDIQRAETGTTALKDAITAVIQGVGEIKTFTPKTSVEIRDLDCAMDASDVEAALRRDIQGLQDLKVHVTKTNSRGQKAAIVQLNTEKAKLLLHQKKIKIGWIINCRIRERIDVERCYKCHGYGHRQRHCKGTDRSKLCYRCGDADHKAGVCKKVATLCAFCGDIGVRDEDRNHIPVSGKCAAFRNILKERKRKR